VGIAARTRSRSAASPAAVEIEAAADDLALAETRDNGKLLREMGGQIRALPAWYEYYAGLADKIDGRVVDWPCGLLRLRHARTVGVVAAIIPWNSPLLPDLEARARTGGGVHDRGEAVGYAGLDPCVSQNLRTCRVLRACSTPSVDRRARSANGS
jgi:hypothetical protein